LGRLCHLQGGSSDGEIAQLVTSSHVEKGEILSLYPIHLLGVASRKKQEDTIQPKKKPKESTIIHQDFCVFDQDRDGDYFQHALANAQQNTTTSQHRLEDIPLLFIQNGKSCRQDLFVDVNPTRITPTAAGWMGHLARKSNGTSVPNCQVMPLPGAAPFCALVATEDLDEGAELIAAEPQQIPRESISSPPESDPQLQQYVTLLNSRYRSQIEELRAYLSMAYQGLQLQPAPTNQQLSFRMKKRMIMSLCRPFTQST
jgi:hypothetical protein